MAKLGIKPLKGKCIVLPHPLEEEVQGGIILPKVALVRRGDKAAVIAENPGEKDSYGFVGREVIVHSGIGQDFEWQGRTCRICPLSVILAVLYTDEWIPLMEEVRYAPIPGETGVQRCRSCRSKGQANVLLVGGAYGQMYCPVCGKIATGKPRRKPKIKEMPDGSYKKQYVESVNEEMAELLGGTEDGKEKQASSKVYSYPGKKKRG